MLHRVFILPSFLRVTKISKLIYNVVDKYIAKLVVFTTINIYLFIVRPSTSNVGLCALLMHFKYVALLPKH